MPFDEAEAAKNRRRSHRKSRFGCGNCKRRRIKCDEGRPSCSNCIRRQVRCEFRGNTASPANAASSDVTPNTVNDGLPTPNTQDTNSNQPTPSAPILHEDRSAPLATFTSNSSLPWNPRTTVEQSRSTDYSPPALDYLDLELLHHYSTTPDIADSHLWRISVPKLSFSDHDLAHFLLSLSALYLSRNSHDRERELRLRADHHYRFAMDTFIPYISNVNAKNCAGIYLCSVLISHNYFARGPKYQPGQYIAFSADGEAEWLTFLRGVQTIMDTMGDTLRKEIADLQYYTHTLESNIEYNEDDEKKRSLDHRRKKEELHDNCDHVPDYAPHFTKLRRFIETFAAEESSFQKYLTALNGLERIFDARYYDRSSRLTIPEDHTPPPPSATPSADSPSTLLFSWLYLLSSDFIACLSQKRPIALVIFSYYAILIKDEAKYLWLLEGWGEHVMSGIWHFLHPEYRSWVEWPIGEIGWKGG